MNYVSIDIGGTFIKYGVMDTNHVFQFQSKVETKVNIDDAIYHQVEAIITEQMHAYTISGVGISTAGIVDRNKGEIVYAGPTIPNYARTAFKKRLTERLNVPVYVENDVNAAMLGEVWKGAAKGADNVYCLTLGTGIGGAHYDNHRLIDGANLKADSIGYLLYDPETKLNYEQRASTSALNNVLKSELGNVFHVEKAFELARSGDKECYDVIYKWTAEVAKGLAQIILMKDPAIILIGGGISRQGDYLLNLIKKQLTIFLPAHFLNTELKIAQLYNDAALYGAVFPFFKED
ncbi:glucokinase [Oceanobacillus oncorhynchi subsp. incaldanensis]|uniref:ROK family protein n=1 Tax=Oceanobacillus TaxID=182709 RepID=UPI001B2C5F98|nr:ROK family protein [Oceanobacillus oncorhynchi]GIO19591.1 glucokinase [Oceanobacillus oncorhynchi subsp. incaldanensis]